MFTLGGSAAGAAAASGVPLPGVPGAPGMVSAAGRLVTPAPPRAVSLSKAKRLIELEDLLLRLKAIDKEMPQEEKKSAGMAGAGEGDRFLAAKSEFLAGMTQVKEALRDMRSGKGATRTRDQIANAQNTRARLKELSKLMAEMEQLYAKEARKKRSKLGREELETRSLFLQQFKGDLETLKRLSAKSFAVGGGAGDDLETGALGTGAATGTSFGAASFFKAMPQVGGAGQGAAGGGGAGAGAGAGGFKEVELTDMQQQSLEQIQMRDQQFDEILDQIGKAVELAGEKAKAINDETQLQNAMLDKLEENIDEVKGKMSTVNVSMKKNLEEKGMGAERFCINCMCCVILLGFIGLIVNTVL